MEKEGLCESEWDTSQSSGPPRRMYYITEAGEEYLEAWVEACKGYRRVMDALSHAYASSRPPRGGTSEGGEVS